MRKFVVHVILGLINQYTIKQSVVSYTRTFIYTYLHEFRKVRYREFFCHNTHKL